MTTNLLETSKRIIAIRFLLNVDVDRVDHFNIFNYSLFCIVMLV